jgi:superkiller protein 3
MKPRRDVTAVLLLAAFGAAGCSKSSETSQTQQKSPGATLTKSVATPGETVTVKQGGEEGLGVNKTPSQTSFADGMAAYQAKKYADATTIFEAYTERRPGNAWGYYMLGLSSWKKGDLADSEQAFEKALSIDPRHVKTLVNLSRVFIEQKRHDEAIERLTRAADIDPGSVEVQRLLGRTYHAQGQLDEAIDAYHRALELNERDAWSMNNLGLLFIETNRADEALPLLAMAAGLRKEVPEFHNNLGMALEHTGRFRAAATAYGDALTADPGYEKAKQNLARVQAVNAGPEEPFQVKSVTKDPVDIVDVPADEKTASE